jgi:NTE family protein
VRFEDLQIPLGVTATDINTRRTVLFRSGFLWPAVLASMAIPGVYPAQTIGNHTLVDGAVMDPLPSHSVATMGADVVVAIRLAGNVSTTPQEAEAVVPSGQGPGVLDVIMRSLEIMQSNIPAAPADVPTIVIAPAFNGTRSVMGLRNFHEGRRFVEVGEAAAEASLPRLAAAIPWLRT